MTQIKVENIFSHHETTDRHQTKVAYLKFRNQLVAALQNEINDIDDQTFDLKRLKNRFLKSLVPDCFIDYKDQFISETQNETKLDVLRFYYGKKFGAEFPITNESQLHFAMNKLTTALIQNTLQGACVIVVDQTFRNQSKQSKSPCYEDIKDYLSVYQSYSFNHPAKLDLIVIQKK